MNLRAELLTKGRLGRQGFWLRHLTVVPVVLWLAIAAGQSPGAPYDLPIVLALVTLLVSIWGRRLHDRGRSAWWLLGSFVPVIGALALIVECGLRGSSVRGDLFGPPSGRQQPYLSVASASSPSSARP